LSFRDVEELIAERGLDVSYETIRRWFLKSGTVIAANFRRTRPRSSDQSHLDEMVIVIRRKRYWLWRAVANEGEVLDSLSTASETPKRHLLNRPMYKKLRSTTNSIRNVIFAAETFSSRPVPLLCLNGGA
jgi:putative transposase